MMLLRKFRRGILIVRNKSGISLEIRSSMKISPKTARITMIRKAEVKVKSLRKSKIPGLFLVFPLLFKLRRERKKYSPLASWELIVEIRDL